MATNIKQDLHAQSFNMKQEDLKDMNSLTTELKPVPTFLQKPSCVQEYKSVKLHTETIFSKEI